MEKEFTENDITLIFYQKPNDQKYSFLIKDDESLTEKILSLVSNKRVTENGIVYCKRSIFDLIKNNKLSQKDQIEKDYVSLVKEELDSFKSEHIPFELEELALKIDQKNNEVTFSLIFNNELVSKTASNKKIAKQLCYKVIFEKYFS